MTFVTTIQAPVSPSDDVYAVARAHPVAAGFRVRPIASAKMLRVTLRGFLSRGAVAEFAAEMGRGIAMIDAGPNQHLVLCDMADTPIQAQIVYDAFESLLNDTRGRPRRLAMVTGNTAGRMQARRLIAGRDDARIFQCETEAMRWLMERPA